MNPYISFRTRAIGLSFAISGMIAAFPQNLVPNPGFEDVLQCPDWQSQLDRTAFWFDPSDGGTPDYYHACGEPLYSVPDNTVGFQQAVDGQAYAGIFLWFGNVLFDWREYLEVELVAPMVAGQCYHFRMHANLGDFSGKTTNDLGVYFAADPIIALDPYPPGMAPHIALDAGAFLDREDWTLLQGEYAANGGERFLMIGNYHFDQETTVQIAPDGPPNAGDFVYCQVDSISLRPCGAIALGVPEAKTDPVVGPMPFTDELRFRTSSRTMVFTVFDASGRVLRRGTAADQVLNTSSWPIGLYVVETRDAEGHSARTCAIKW